MAKHTQTIREFNPFHVTSFYLYPLKTPEKRINMFSDVLVGKE